MKVTGVMVVRDAVSLLGPILRYHRAAAGFDEWLVIDNGSSDGTTDLLATLARRDPAIRFTVDTGPFEQGLMFTDLAREAHRRGADWVVPTDADEVWWTDRPGGVRAALLDTADDVGVWVCPVEQFVQQRWARRPHPASMLTMVHVADPIGTMHDARHLVEQREIAFVEMTYPPKCVSRATPDLVSVIGNHEVGGHLGQSRSDGPLRVLHAPIPDRPWLGLRAEQGRRIAEVSDDPDVCWHIRRMAALDDAGRLDEEWAASSVHRGAIEVAGRARRLRPDTRLAEALGPFVDARDRRLGPLRARGALPWRPRPATLR